MNTRYLLTTVCLLSTVLLSCEKEDAYYETPDCHLNFAYGDATSEQITEAMITTTYSFRYAGDTVRNDTLWFEVETMGFLSPTDRPLRLQQFPAEEVENAVPGRHYTAFDDAGLAQFYRIPANQSKVRIPVVLLRGDTALRTRAMTLKFGFAANEFFTPGYEEMCVRIVHITDYLTEPAGWRNSYSLGRYGQMKHQLMIEWTGEPWDEQYIKTYINTDAAYRTYILGWLRKKLAEENDKRLADPAIGDVYRETDGSAVSF